jgi:methionyl-tRNA formyltransferase
MANGKIIFFGTPGICLPFLEKLKENFDIRLIITSPDSVGGRHRQKIIPAVKGFALENRIELAQPEILKSPDLVEKIERKEPDIGVVIAYGKLIPKAVFTIPTHNTINVHFSLLPGYRGAAPVQRAIENGDTFTGITIFEINRKMDSGAIWAQKQFEILPDDTSDILFERLSREGAPFLVTTIKRILGNEIQKRPQDHERASHAPMVAKEEGQVDWNLSARQLYNKFRAFTPWPGLFFYLNHQCVKIKKLRVYGEPWELESLLIGKKAGDIIGVDKSSLKVCCGGQSVLEIIEMQPECKRPMTPHCYALGHPLPPSLND